MKSTHMKTPFLPANPTRSQRTRWCVLAAALALAACGLPGFGAAAPGFGRAANAADGLREFQAIRARHLLYE